MKGTSALPKNVSVTAQPGYKSLILPAKNGKVYIKISGFYRSSKLTTGDYDDLEPLIKALVKEVPNQLIWIGLAAYRFWLQHDGGKQSVSRGI
jgi:predicted TIM-barrel fold metal-dependent hydrolase